jgi:hypothetical protein
LTNLFINKNKKIIKLIKNLESIFIL